MADRHFCYRNCPKYTAATRHALLRTLFETWIAAFRACPSLAAMVAPSGVLKALDSLHFQPFDQSHWERF
jgi:hypothetical protein